MCWTWHQIIVAVPYYVVADCFGPLVIQRTTAASVRLEVEEHVSVLTCNAKDRNSFAGFMDLMDKAYCSITNSSGFANL